MLLSSQPYHTPPLASYESHGELSHAVESAKINHSQQHYGMDAPTGDVTYDDIYGDEDYQSLGIVVGDDCVFVPLRRT